MICVRAKQNATIRKANDNNDNDDEENDDDNNCRNEWRGCHFDLSLFVPSFATCAGAAFTSSRPLRFLLQHLFQDSANRFER
eukprot:918342-Amphidinium_carterae.1